MHRKQKLLLPFVHLLLLALDLRSKTKHRTHVPSRDYQLHFCQH